MMAAEAIRTTTLGELLGPTAYSHAEVEITDLVLDSREVTPGAAFVALAGERDHGLNHFEQALARGAAVVLYEPDGEYSTVPEPSVAVPYLRAQLGEIARRFFGRGRLAGRLAGVTGTNGKTTVAWLVAQAMTRRRGRCGYVGTLGFGVPPGLETHALTTPDCLTLHRELASLAAPCSVLEVSSHALDQNRVAGLTFALAAFTNFSRDHLDHHGDLLSYGRAKSRLFLRSGLEAAVLNVADPFVAELGTKLDPRVVALKVAATDRVAADLVGRAESRGFEGLTVDVTGSRGTARIESPLIGDFNAENLLVALGMLLAWDVPLGEACDLLGACSPAPGRMEVLKAPAAPAVVVDYAHTPAGLERALATVQELAAGDIWCVFGCGGERDAGKRSAMGAVAARGAEHLVLTDDNPRGEDPALIVADIRAGVGAHRDVRVEHAREEAIASTIARAAPDDVVLVAGKGNERVQLTAAGPRPFNDSDVVAKVLGVRN